MSLPGIGCGRGKTTRPWWEVAVTRDRMQLECIRIMVGCKRAGGNDRMEQRASRHRHRGVGSWWQFSFWQKIVYNSYILKFLQKSLITLHNYSVKFNRINRIYFLFKSESQFFASKALEYIVCWWSPATPLLICSYRKQNLAINRPGQRGALGWDWYLLASVQLQWSCPSSPRS